MVFSSVTFLFFFLPATLAVVTVAPARLRNVVLLAASLLFYTWGSHWFVVVLIATSLIDWLLVGRARTAHERDEVQTRRQWLAASIVLNLGVLAYFKYAGFFSVDILGRFTPFDSPPGWLTDVVLPVGISFFTFQRISYAVDVSTGRDDPTRNFVDYLLYICLFPQLIAGPIVRYRDISAQLRDRTVSIPQASDGVVRFSLGLAKKVLIADTLSPVVGAIFDGGGDVSTPAAIIGVVGYTLQLYFDFSGYSDMAIGLGLMLGFSFPENFDRPYTAHSVTEFWRRWHITLSTWFRDYLYIPLGGNRSGHTYRNLAIVFLLTGLWHGAAWTFVLWGAFHGGILLLERRLGGKLLPGVAGRVVTLGLVMAGWVIFRAQSLGRAGEIFEALLRFDFGPARPDIAVALDTRTMLALVLGSLVFFMPRNRIASDRSQPDRRALRAPARVALVGLALPAALLVAATQASSPFLYFQF